MLFFHENGASNEDVAHMYDIFYVNFSRLSRLMQKIALSMQIEGLLAFMQWNTVQFLFTVRNACNSHMNHRRASSYSSTIE